MDTKSDRPKYASPIIIPLGQIPVGKGANCPGGNAATGSCGGGNSAGGSCGGGSSKHS